MKNYVLKSIPIIKLSATYLIFSNPLFKFVRKLIFIFLLVILLTFAGYYSELFEISPILIGFMQIIFVFIAIYYIYDLYIRARIENYTPSSSVQESLHLARSNQAVNWLETFDYDAGLVFQQAYDLAQRHQSPITTQILLHVFSKNVRGKYLLLRSGVDFTGFAQMKNFQAPPNSQGYVYDQNVGKVIFAAAQNAIYENRNEISVGDLFVGLFDADPVFNQMINNLGLKKSDIQNIVYWDHSEISTVKNKKRFWKDENIVRSGGIGRDWAAGYTNNLDKIAEDITLTAESMPYHIIGHDNEIKQLERLLLRAQRRNVILVGEPGVGKRTIVMGFAKKIAEGKTGTFQVGKHVYKIDTARLLAGAGNPHEVEERIITVFNEAVRAGNIIIFIESIDNLFNRSGSEGTIDASQLLLPYLSSPNIQIIGTMAYDAYNNLIQSNASLAGTFEKIEIKEPGTDATIRILEDVVPLMEYKSSCLVTYPAIKATVDLAGRFIHDQPYPEKAITLLDETIAYVTMDLKKKLIISQDVEKVISQKAKVPVGQVENQEKQKLMNLEGFLRQRVIEQEEAIAVIADALRRARAGLSSGKRPIGNFLFLGPTGVGKTETCKALAENYFGSERDMIRLDMSEYQSVGSINKLIGSQTNEGYQAGVLTKAVKNNPFSLILLDELEKASGEILNLFLQVMDDGRLTDGAGRTIDFTNTIIIATSNAGAELIRQSIKKQETANLKEKLVDYLQKEHIFRPEFLNRFDAVVSFKPLSENAIVKVAGLMVKDLNQRLSKKDVQITVPADVLAKLAHLGYDPEMGARPMRRVIQDKVENLIAKKILSGELQKGTNYTLKMADIG